MRYNKWSGLKLNGLIAGKQGVAFVEDKLKDPSIKPYCARLCEICEELSTASAEDLTPLLSPPIQVRVVGHVSKADSPQGYAQYFLITTIGDINQGGTLKVRWKALKQMHEVLSTKVFEPGTNGKGKLPIVPKTLKLSQGGSSKEEGREVALHKYMAELNSCARTLHEDHQFELHGLVRSSKLTVAFSQSSYILITYRVVAIGGGLQGAHARDRGAASCRSATDSSRSDSSRSDRGGRRAPRYVLPNLRLPFHTHLYILFTYGVVAIDEFEHEHEHEHELEHEQEEIVSKWLADKARQPQEQIQERPKQASLPPQPEREVRYIQKMWEPHVDEESGLTVYRNTDESTWEQLGKEKDRDPASDYDNSQTFEVATSFEKAGPVGIRWIEKKCDLALNAGVFIDSLVPGLPAKQIPGMCPGMRLVRAQVRDEPEIIVDGQTQATVSYLWSEGKRPLKLVFVHPWRIVTHETGEYFWNTHDNATTRDRPEILAAALEPPAPPEPEPEPEPQPQAVKHPLDRELCPGWQAFKDRAGVVKHYHNTNTGAKRRADTAPAKLTRAEMQAWEMEDDFKYTATGRVRRSDGELGVVFEQFNSKPRIKKINSESCMKKHVIPSLVKGMILVRITLYADEGDTLGEELQTGPGRGKVPFKQALAYLKGERPLKLTFNHPWQRVGIGDSERFLNSRTGEERLNRPEELAAVLEAMQAWDMSRYPDNMTKLRDRPLRAELHQQPNGSPRNRKDRSELEKPVAKVTPAVVQIEAKGAVESKPASEQQNGLSEADDRRPAPWLEMHKQMHSDTPVCAGTDTRGVLTLTWKSDCTDFLDIQPQVIPRRLVRPCKGCQMSAPTQTVSFEIGATERLQSLHLVWVHGHTKKEIAVQHADNLCFDILRNEPFESKPMPVDFDGRKTFSQLQICWKPSQKKTAAPLEAGDHYWMMTVQQSGVQLVRQLCIVVSEGNDQSEQKPEGNKVNAKMMCLLGGNTISFDLPDHTRWEGLLSDDGCCISDGTVSRPEHSDDSDDSEPAVIFTGIRSKTVEELSGPYGKREKATDEVCKSGPCCIEQHVNKDEVVKWDLRVKPTKGTLRVAVRRVEPTVKDSGILVKQAAALKLSGKDGNDVAKMYEPCKTPFTHPFQVQLGEACMLFVEVIVQFRPEDEPDGHKEKVRLSTKQGIDMRDWVTNTHPVCCRGFQVDLQGRHEGDRARVTLDIDWVPEVQTVNFEVRCSKLTVEFAHSSLHTNRYRVVGIGVVRAQCSRSRRRVQMHFSTRAMPTGAW